MPQKRLQISQETSGGNASLGFIEFFLLLCFGAVILWASLNNLTNLAPGWMHGALILIAAAWLVISLARILPFQNVVLACGIVLVVSSAFVLISPQGVLPLGRFEETRNSPFVRWATPFLFLLQVLVSRGVARALLAPWKQRSNYGFWVPGIASILMFAFAFALDAYAGNFRAYSASHSNTDVSSDVPLHLYAINCLLGVITLTVITPTLLNKKFTCQPRHSGAFSVWLFSNLLFLSGPVAGHLWLKAACILAINITLVATSVIGRFVSPVSKHTKT